jgi:tetratricopeptide (TPR) repeat protein
VVFEDLQWADEATLDLLRVLGRRLRDLPALIIGTFRDDEVGSEHPLRLALGDVPAREIANLPVPPLTAAAVKTLTGSSGIDAEALHAATAGNPFFVTEVVAEGGDKLPTTIRDTVLARVARLSPPAAHALRAAAVIGQRCEPRLLQDVADCDASVLAECLSRGMLQQEGLMLRFRHELAQRALYEGLAPAERAALHGRALKAIRRRVVTADPAELAYHALEAGDAETVIELAPVAAERATELGAHREAAAHYGTALLFSQAMEEGSRAELLENHARECFMADNVEGALTSQQEALECWHRLGNVRREGDCLRALSSMLWYAGDGIRARETAESAARLLESVSSPVPELARAYATVAQLHLDGGHDHSIVLAFGERALGLAERLGDEPVTIHALNTIGTAEICMGRERGWSKLQESLKRAKIAGLHDDAARALANLVVESKIVRRYELFDQYFDEAIVYTADHGLDLYRRYLLGELAEVTLERGRWEAAAESALALLAQSRTANLIRVKALTVLGRLQARRGESGCWSLLDESLDMAGRRGDLFDCARCTQRAPRRRGSKATWCRQEERARSGWPWRSSITARGGEVSWGSGCGRRAASMNCPMGQPNPMYSMRPGSIEKPPKPGKRSAVHTSRRSLWLTRRARTISDRPW